MQAQLDGRATPESIAHVMQYRRETNEYVQADVANGVTLVWDNDSQPYIVLDRDSPYHVGQPERHYLNDYGSDGDEIAALAERALRNINPEWEPEFEHDRWNSNEAALIFHCNGVYE